MSPAGPKPLQKRAAKGLKIEGHGCNVNVNINEISPDLPPAPRAQIAAQVGHGWGLRVGGRAGGQVADPRACMSRVHWFHGRRNSSLEWK